LEKFLLFVTLEKYGGVKMIDISAIEKKKKYLKRYKKNMACIDRLKIKLHNLDDKIKSIKSPNYSGMPKGGQPVTLEELLSDKLDLEKRIDRLSNKKASLKNKVLEEIDNLEDDRYVEVLESFFIDCKTHAEIAEDMGYQERHVIRLYSEAIRELVEYETMTL
jgi:DNA-directed RNA polymerase specialized sigma subunit